LPIFFLGGRPSVTEGSYFNLKKSFPEMKVVGRHTGYFDNNREKAVLQAIRKTSPKVLLVGLGYPKELEWIRRNQKQLENMVVIGVGGSFDIMSGKAKKAPDFFQNRGLTWLYRIITRPYRLLAWWRMFLFYLFTLFFHLFKKPNKKQAQKK
jgi:N-acetylglucosaminyldiphosphoundecaprenol N-acetyl-beta-D-mannosaminyltransferase